MSSSQPPPPPPPLLTTVLGSSLPNSLQTSNNDEGISCLIKGKRISHEEAKKQLEQVMSIELNSLILNGSIQEDIGMMVLMIPILEPLLQSGPVCGLIALLEAAQILDINLNLDPDRILNEAIRLGVTKKGEMFSTEAMKRLIMGYVQCDGRIIDTKSVGCFKELLFNILRGNPALIPYDADHNHSPAMRKGHAAHWAVLHGFALLMPCTKIMEIVARNNGTRITQIDKEDLSSINEVSKLVMENSISADTTYVIAHQGKSSRAAVWKYNDLIQSNQNLNEVSPKITSSSEEFILGDIQLELCSTILLLTKN